MAPIGVDYRTPKGFMVVHRCVRCGFMRPNRAAPDDMEALLRLMRGV
jgi:RNHCP domain-containing protein